MLSALCPRSAVLPAVLPAVLAMLFAVVCLYRILCVDYQDVVVAYDPEYSITLRQLYYRSRLDTAGEMCVSAFMKKPGSEPAEVRSQNRFLIHGTPMQHLHQRNWRRPRCLHPI